MPTIPTVRVVSPVSPGGYIVINASDLRDDHEIWEDAEREPETHAVPAYAGWQADVRAGSVELALRREAAASEALPLQIVKGPRGRFFVKRGPMSFHGGNVFESPGFDSREEAEAALGAMRSEAQS